MTSLLLDSSGQSRLYGQPRSEQGNRPLMEGIPKTVGPLFTYHTSFHEIYLEDLRWGDKGDDSDPWKGLKLWQTQQKAKESTTIRCNKPSSWPPALTHLPFAGQCA